MSARSLLIISLLASIIAASHCNPASNKCRHDCRTEADCLNKKSQDKDEDCLKHKAGGYCNRGVKCGQPCNSSADCTPPEGGQCWAEVTCGKCNYLSHYKCGERCGVEEDCSPGNCWATITKHECDILKLYCDAESGDKCGQECKTEDDSQCSPGHCVTYQAHCGNSGSGYCSLESKNCGTSCTNSSNCLSGFCLKFKEMCASVITIGTYTGALPGGERAPPLSLIPKDVNLIMLSFAKDPNHNGNFQPFSEWERQGLTKTNIAQDKTQHPDRKYLVSLGGTNSSGGNFQITANMTTKQWVSNSLQSVVNMIQDFSADGAEMQFEGSTNDPRFKDAMTGLLKGLKEKGYATAIGPYYGPYGTWHDYKPIPTEYVDYVNMQFYSVQDHMVDHMIYFIQAVQQELGSDRGKLVAGFNSNSSPPKPPVSLESVYDLRSSLKGVFTWDIEHSANNHPPYCLENGFAVILKHGNSPGECAWN